MVRPLRLLSILLPLVLSLAARPALAQPKPEPMDDYAALGLGRIALLDLRMQPDPTPADYQITRLALDLARTYAPDDAILLRR
ncbi:MAG: hypothetical protein ACIAQU_07700, partial [Phycisphaerales bacterium JB064]